MPSLALDGNVEPRALQETCRLADENIGQGLTLQGYRVQYTSSVEHGDTYLLLRAQLRGAIGGVGDLGVDWIKGKEEEKVGTNPGRTTGGQARTFAFVLYHRHDDARPDDHEHSRAYKT